MKKTTEHNSPEGVFQVIDSFAIRKRNQFYLIGKLTKGEIKKEWFVNIGLNEGLAITVRINDIEEIEMASETETHTLLVVNCDENAIDLLLGMNIGLENLPITIDGQD
jgi:hypothetical protein